MAKANSTKAKRAQRAQITEAPTISSIYDQIQAQQQRAYTAQGMVQVIRRRLEVIEGDEMELCHVRSSLAAAEEILGAMGNQLDFIEGSLREATGVQS